MSVLNKISKYLFAVFSLTLLSTVSAQAENTITIGALVSGQVTAVFVESGQTVKKGEKLLNLDGQRYQAKLKVLRAQMAAAKATMSDAKIELDQALDLFDRTVTSKRTLDASQLRYDQAKAAYDQSRAEVVLHQSWAKYVYIKAPIDGKVSKIFTQVGSTVFKENTPMIELQY